MVMLSKNVVRSMKTDIKKKRDKAVQYIDMASCFDAEADALEKYMLENSEPEQESKKGCITPIENPEEQPEMPPIPANLIRKSN